jgi:hypothetical protein
MLQLPSGQRETLHIPHTRLGLAERPGATVVVVGRGVLPGGGDADAASGGAVVPGTGAADARASRQGRAEAVERLARWKRGIAAGTVVAFGAFIGLIGVAGARGSSSPSGEATPRPPTVTSQADGPTGGDRGVAPSTAPDDGFFDPEDGGYGFGGGSAQSTPLGRSGVS